MKTKPWLPYAASIAAALHVMLPGHASGADNAFAVQERSIAYAIWDAKWAIYETDKDGKQECPDGINKVGPREQFNALFPSDGARRKLVDAQLAEVAEHLWPSDSPDKFPFLEAAGSVSVGLDLDGKVKESDFTAPDGRKGIDNQLFRVIGCVMNYRSNGTFAGLEPIFFKKKIFNRLLIEITDLDSLENDDDVTVTTYRGLNPVMSDASGNGFQPGGTQRLDLKWGQEFIHRTKGRIDGGVLTTTQPMDVIMPAEMAYDTAVYHWLRDARLEVKLTSVAAEGIIGGYADIETFHRSRTRQWATVHLGYGQEMSSSVYKAMQRHADAFPDARGQNTAISSAYAIKAIQVLVHRDDAAPDAGHAVQTRGEPAAQ